MVVRIPAGAPSLRSVGQHFENLTWVTFRTGGIGHEVYLSNPRGCGNWCVRDVVAQPLGLSIDHQPSSRIYKDLYVLELNDQAVDQQRKAYGSELGPKTKPTCAQLLPISIDFLTVHPSTNDLPHSTPLSSSLQTSSTMFCSNPLFSTPSPRHSPHTQLSTPHPSHLRPSPCMFNAAPPLARKTRLHIVPPAPGDTHPKCVPSISLRFLSLVDVGRRVFNDRDAVEQVRRATYATEPWFVITSFGILFSHLPFDAS